MAVESDPTSLKIEKNHNAMVQNLALGMLLTVAYLSAPLVGIHDFDTKLYIVSLLLGFGIINYLPKTNGLPPGSIGGFTFIKAILLAMSGKHV